MKSSKPNKRTSCKDCALYWGCPDRSRNYPCKKFKPKEETK